MTNERKYEDYKCGRLCVLSVALSLGVIWAIVVFALGVSSIESLGYGDAFVKLLSSIYIGYTNTWLGSLIGGVWGFFDAFIGGLAFAWLYNFFSGMCCKTSKSK